MKPASPTWRTRLRRLSAVQWFCGLSFTAFVWTWLFKAKFPELMVIHHLFGVPLANPHQFPSRISMATGCTALTLLVLLWALQWGMARLTRLRGWAWVLTFAPSLMVLAAATALPASLSTAAWARGWLWLVPALLLWSGCVVTAKRLTRSEEKPSVAWRSPLCWGSMAALLLMEGAVVLVAESQPTLHYRAEMEKTLMYRQTDVALTVGQMEERSDSALTMLRAYALSQQGQLGDSLFAFPLKGGADALLPRATAPRLLLLSPDLFYRPLGDEPQHNEPTLHFLQRLNDSPHATVAAQHYWLVALLLERQLDAFARALPQRFTVTDSLPLHYREALTLYTHLRQHPSIIYHHNVMNADYEDFMSLMRRRDAASKAQLREAYGHTYWYYYFNVGTTKHTGICLLGRTARASLQCKSHFMIQKMDI